MKICYFSTPTLVPCSCCFVFSPFQVSEETFFPLKRRHQYSTSSDTLLHFTTYLHPFPLSVSKKMSLPFSEVKTSYICNFDFMLSKSSTYINYHSSQLYNFCLFKGSFCSIIHHFSINDVGQLLMYLLVICMSSLENVLILSSIFNRIIWGFVIDLYFFLYFGY